AITRSSCPAATAWTPCSATGPSCPLAAGRSLFNSFGNEHGRNHFPPVAHPSHFSNAGFAAFVASHSCVWLMLRVPPAPVPMRVRLADALKERARSHHHRLGVQAT